MSCTCEADAFRAEAHPTGENRLLSVTGTCSCPMTGYHLELEPYNEGVNPDPEQVTLRLVEAPGEAGEDTDTDTPVSYDTEISDQAKFVVIRHDGNTLRVPIVDPG